MITKFIRSILAGLCISLGAAIFCKLGGIIGSVMFAFGLICVIHFKMPLYTGTAGFINTLKIDEWKSMLVILLGNIIGTSLIILLGVDNISESASKIIQSRIDAGYLLCLSRAIGCGLIMTLIVKGGRDGNWLPILFGIPLFILLGFYHSIADPAYFFLSDMDINYLPYYLIIVLGNFIGCNVPRILKYE